MVGKEEFPKFQLFPWQQKVLDNLMKLNKGSHYITLKGIPMKKVRIASAREESPFKQEIDLPDGIYEGSQSGYQVTLPDPIHTTKLYETKTGIRGMNFPRKVEVKNRVGTFV